MTNYQIFLRDEARSADNEGMPLTANALRGAAAELDRLEHHEAATIGLWATDMPNEITDPRGLLFQITRQPESLPRKEDDDG